MILLSLLQHEQTRLDYIVIASVELCTLFLLHVLSFIAV